MYSWTSGHSAYLPIAYAGNEATTNCLMSEGSRGLGVRALQNTLATCYGSSLEVDGIFGPKTRDRLKSVQRLHGITADGIYGPETRDTLLWAGTHSYMRCRDRS